MPDSRPSELGTKLLQHETTLNSPRYEEHRMDLERKLTQAERREVLAHRVAVGALVMAVITGVLCMSQVAGSADVLEALGARTDLGGEQVARVIEGCGFGFLFAQRFHPAMKHVAGPRRELGVRTVFNLLGPLTNPARPKGQLAGVGAAAAGPLLAEAFRLRGMPRAMVVHSADGLDEISSTGESRISEVREGTVRSYTVRPEDFGVPRAAIEDLQGGDRQQNAQIIRAVLDGEVGPRRDIVLVNAAAALVAGGRARDLKEGVALAAQSIDRGAARDKLDDLIGFSQELAREP